MGLVSRSDALQWQVEGIPADATLREVLSDASQPSAWPETPIGEVADLMVESGMGRVPIVDPESRRVVGLLSRQDLLKARGAHTRTESHRSR